MAKGFLKKIKLSPLERACLELFGETNISNYPSELNEGEYIVDIASGDIFEVQKSAGSFEPATDDAFDQAKALAKVLDECGFDKLATFVSDYNQLPLTDYKLLVPPALATYIMEFIENSRLLNEVYVIETDRQIFVTLSDRLSTLEDFLDRNITIHQIRSSVMNTLLQAVNIPEDKYPT